MLKNIIRKSSQTISTTNQKLHTYEIFGNNKTRNQPLFLNSRTFMGLKMRILTYFTRESHQDISEKEKWNSTFSHAVLQCLKILYKELYIYNIIYKI